MSTEAKKFIDENYSEFPDTVLHANLCIAFARLDGRSVNDAVRKCCRAVLERITDDTNRKIIAGVARQPFPDGAVSMLRRQLDSMLTYGKVD